MPMTTDFDGMLPPVEARYDEPACFGTKMRVEGFCFGSVEVDGVDVVEDRARGEGSAGVALSGLLPKKEKRDDDVERDEVVEATDEMEDVREVEEESDIIEEREVEELLWWKSGRDICVEVVRRIVGR